MTEFLLAVEVLKVTLLLYTEDEEHFVQNVWTVQWVLYIFHFTPTRLVWYGVV